MVIFQQNITLLSPCVVLWVSFCGFFCHAVDISDYGVERSGDWWIIGWKETVVTYLTYYPWIFRRNCGKPQKTLFRIVDVPAEIRATHHSNTINELSNFTLSEWQFCASCQIMTFSFALSHSEYKVTRNSSAFNSIHPLLTPAFWVSNVSYVMWRLH